MTEKENRIKVDKKTRFKVAARSTLILGSFNYERMQNGGVCYSMIPAIKKLYKSESDRAEALKRHLEFFNTTPELFSPILGVVLSLEQDKANGADVDDSAISGVKVGMMGPLAGIGDPIFLFTLRPILGSLCGAMAISGNVLGPILFFVLWNLIRGIFMWNLQEFGYKAGSKITEDVSGSLLHDVTRGASMMGMFVLGGLIVRLISNRLYQPPKCKKEHTLTGVHFLQVMQVFKKHLNFTTTAKGLHCHQLRLQQCKTSLIN